jgi:anti-sigma regulatory factor (Ser/Thr protein kinase)/anti-anti-sigma regulatory factor
MRATGTAGVSARCSGAGGGGGDAPTGELGPVVIVNVARDFERGVIVVRLDGKLACGAAAGVRSVLLKALASYPLAVIIDLNGVPQCNDIALSIVASAQRRAKWEPAVDVILCTLHPEVARQVRRSFRHSPIHATYDDALAEVSRSPAAGYRTHLHLPPTAEAPSLARVLVGDACLDWYLPHLLHPARWIVSELTQNAVEHAGTDIDVAVTLRDRHLCLSVHDRSPQPVRLRNQVSDPRAPMDHRGQGLRIVAQNCTRWGFVTTPDGKTVWATMASDPPATGAVPSR